MRCADAGAIVVAFRGTEATNLLNWQTNITINMTCRDGLGGVLLRKTPAVCILLPEHGAQVAASSFADASDSGK